MRGHRIQDLFEGICILAGVGLFIVGGVLMAIGGSSTPMLAGFAVLVLVVAVIHWRGVPPLRTPKEPERDYGGRRASLVPPDPARTGAQVAPVVPFRSREDRSGR
jgi:membrane protein implicated in regulation of membrane protease activity